MGDLLLDPVCGMEIESGGAVASAVAEGRRFHFCCPRCYAAFLDTPHRYVGWPGEPVRPVPVAVAPPTSSRLGRCPFAS